MTIAPPTQWGSLTVATANLLNLALPNRRLYDNQDMYSDVEYAKKLAWLGQSFARLNADVLCVQEVWDEAALKAVAVASGLRNMSTHAPGAEHGAQGTPCVGLVTRLHVECIDSFIDLPPGHAVEIPELGEKTKFERAPLLARLRTHEGQSLHVLTTHMKSKRPKFLQDGGDPNRNDPRATARATLRSLLIRATEAAALRSIVVDVLSRTQEPLIVMGDFNDGPHSVTTQMIAATNEVAYDKGARDTALFNANDVQAMPLKRDVAYTRKTDPVLVAIATSSAAFAGFAQPTTSHATRSLGLFGWGIFEHKAVRLGARKPVQFAPFAFFAGAVAQRVFRQCCAR